MKSVLMLIGNAGRVVLFAGLLGASAFASDPSPTTTSAPLCSLDTFKGDYGFTVNGTITPGSTSTTTPPYPIPVSEVIYIQGVQMIHSDGKGNLTDNEALVLNGAPLVNAPPSFFSLHTGTYTLNSNCTGLAYLSNVSEGGVNFIWLSFVVTKGGREIRMVGVPPFDSGGVPRTVTSVGELFETSPEQP